MPQIEQKVKQNIPNQTTEGQGAAYRQERPLRTQFSKENKYGLATCNQTRLSENPLIRH